MTHTSTPTRTPIFSPTRTLTPRTIGGEITAFGVARADGRVIRDIGVEESGYPIFLRPASGFLLYVEARPGISQLPVGTSTFNLNPSNPDVLPDLQMVASRPLGNGSAAVCDINTNPVGGVPAVNPPIFGGTQAASNAINDLSCRFDARTASSLACTRNRSGEDSFVGAGSTIQFCTTSGVGAELTFPLGDTHLRVRVRDIVGQPGQPRDIIIRVLDN